MALAVSTGNISAILNQIIDASTLTEDDFIEKTVGNLRFLYYSYLDTFHNRPKDIVDMIDGLLYIECKSYIQQQAINRQERMMREGKK